MKPSTRRSFFAALMTAAAIATIPEAEARGRSGGRSGGRSSRGGGGGGSYGYSGGGRGGCGSRGGAGYRKDNGKCAGRNE